ncbi:MAG: 2,3,4,5-tetrahydropyridine-2,6-dicarboxylate N-succinyltransferase, partial [Alphaproteobacteria bacterium MarineAlpha5_Bin10]
MENLKKIVNDAWENKEQINQNSDESILNSINQIIENLDQGKLRVAEKIDGSWTTHQYIKKAIMLSFRVHGMEALSGPYSSWFDKAHLLKGKTAGWTKEEFEKAGFRMVPNTPVRKGSFIAKNVVL